MGAQDRNTEVKISTITNGSGSQCLAHAMGKLHVMKLVLTHRACVEHIGGHCTGHDQDHKGFYQ